ncbi:hypothetical protein HMPREF9371_0046 [Neisseria shayeganii 871]|uniref:Uncharacterized protein n=1 Tax=Neisseria shayeganii 871 TaxID=1032488 RepID=G4CEK7_9NEIS|nr:hypothetical protein HMPREF9371_0046 [Neisseria shayeganii 871]
MLFLFGGPPAKGGFRPHHKPVPLCGQGRRRKKPSFVKRLRQTAGKRFR